VEGLSLEEYNKGLVGFSSLVEKGFPGYFLCMVFLLVILVTATNCLWCNCNCLWFN
jgi:hypothetical protein